MRRLVVLGASGGVGQELVKQARERGWEVTAVTRPGSATNAVPGVTARVGDPADRAFLTEALRGADAVASGLGIRLAGLAPWTRPEQPDFLTRSTPALIDAMRAAGVGRIVAVSAAGVGDSKERVPTVFRAFIRATALRHAYAELEVMERLLLASGLDVCLCRPGGLSNGPRTTPARVVAQTTSARIARADVAAWMLEQLETTPFPHHTAQIAV
jgi:putative NADH-flavin reductase